MMQMQWPATGMHSDAMPSDWPVSTWTASGRVQYGQQLEGLVSEMQQGGAVCYILSLVRHFQEAYQSSMPPPIGYSKYTTAD